MQVSRWRERSNALVQLQAQYNHCGEAASEKCLGSCSSSVDTHGLRRAPFEGKRREVVQT
jgi:hypothetical protein